MAYELLYDLGQQGWHQEFWLVGGIAVLLPAGWLRWRRARQGGATAMPSFMMLFGTVMLGCGLITLWDHHRLLDHLQAGRVTIAEGLVASHSVQQLSSYDPQSKRYNRREWESFLVGETAFGFSRDASAVGFANADKLVLRDGERLRIAYVEDVAGDYSQRRILRLERATKQTAQALP